jgi:hypothetical protein
MFHRSSIAGWWVVGCGLWARRETFCDGWRKWVCVVYAVAHFIECRETNPRFVRELVVVSHRVHSWGWVVGGGLWPGEKLSATGGASGGVVCKRWRILSNLAKRTQVCARIGIHYTSGPEYREKSALGGSGWGKCLEGRGEKAERIVTAVCTPGEGTS